jgi:predicted nucleotidyltransferase
MREKLALLSKVFLRPPLSQGVKREMDLVSLTSEGMVVLTLTHGKHSYSELRNETGLSDRWLTIKLKELEEGAVLKKDGKWYGLIDQVAASPHELSLYMLTQARQLARQLAQLHSVRVIILFGSVAKEEAHEYSDLDMLIAVDQKDVESVRRRVASKISEFERRFHLTVEPVVLSTADFLVNIRSEAAGIIYGIAEGFKVLVAKDETLRRILSERVEEIRRTRQYLEEGRIWLKAE